MNRFLPKVLIFLTFFGSCIVIGLLLSALVTNVWITANVSFLTSNNATSTRNQFGTVELGLFNYQKALNRGYGLRHENFKVIEIVKTEDGFMDYWLWLLTALGTGFALFASAVSAIASVIGTIRQRGGMAMMVVSNVCAGAGQVIAFVCWILQFIHFLQHNVLLGDDKKVWTSRGQATFGYSFYFIIFAFFVVVTNLILLLSARRIEVRHKKSIEPIEEKEGNSIMLY
jgi:clarin